MKRKLDLGFPYFIDLMCPCIGLAQKVMPAFDAEMRNIDDGRRIVGQDRQNIAFRHGFQAFACLENRQRAQKPKGVERVRIIHALRYGAGVTTCPLTCEGWVRDAAPAIA